MTEGGEEVAGQLAATARRWLDRLDDAQRAQAVFAFDDQERFAWDYVPGPRRGLSIAEMTGPQREGAMALVDAALSERGAREVRGIIALETILGELEQRGGRGNWMRRDPDLYWYSIFGTPGGAGPWSWRIGGHHLALQTTISGGRPIGATPSFLGANPATVPEGPAAGARTIDGEERLARDLLAALTRAQRHVAIVDPVAPPDIRSGSGRRADLADVPTGIHLGDLGPGTRAAAEALIRHYLERMAPALAEAEWGRLHDAGLDAITFAWAGGEQPGQGHYYAIRGPRLLIEYDNTQNGANHIHSVWRDPTNDWGEDLLAAHYRVGHAGP